jgi:hypothetical protein
MEALPTRLRTTRSLSASASFVVAPAASPSVLRLLFFLLVTASLLVGGCGAAEPGRDATGVDDRLLAVQQLEEAIGGDPAESSVRGEAADVFMDSCLAEQGFTRKPEYSSRMRASEEDEARLDAGSLDYWWGVSLPELAEEYGYHEVPMEEFLEVRNASETPPPEYLEAAVGAAFLEGTTNTPGGCAGRWEAEFYAGVELTREEIQLISEGLRTSYKEKSRLTETAASAVKRWSDCMAREGYSYDAPHDALAEFTSTVGNPDGRDGIGWITPSPTDEEIRIAVADAQCKVETGFWDAIAVAEDEAAQEVIDSNRPQLEELRRVNSALVRNAGKILSETSPK